MNATQLTEKLTYTEFTQRTLASALARASFDVPEVWALEPEAVALALALVGLPALEPTAEPVASVNESPFYKAAKPAPSLHERITSEFFLLDKGGCDILPTFAGPMGVGK